MSNKPKSAGKKKYSQRSLRDRYWKQVMVLAEKRQWQELGDYVDANPWLATANMGPTILPDYLAGEKGYGLLRLLCNVEDVPLFLIKKIISLGASDKNGRAYLERLLVGDGSDKTELDRQRGVAANSPMVAAEVLKTCENPVDIIDKMHGIIEEGLRDNDSERQALARRCIGRSQLFFELMQILYENDSVDLLIQCLGDEKLLQLALVGKLTDFSVIEGVFGD